MDTRLCPKCNRFSVTLDSYHGIIRCIAYDCSWGWDEAGIGRAAGVPMPQMHDYDMGTGCDRKITIIRRSEDADKTRG